MLENEDFEGKDVEVDGSDDVPFQLRVICMLIFTKWAQKHQLQSGVK